VNIESNEQSKQWMHTHSPNKPKKVKRLSESWWQLFSGTGKECWMWNSCNKGPQ
jgi:hypothetical protein